MILKPAAGVEGAAAVFVEECMWEEKITKFVSKIKNKEQNKLKKQKERNNEGKITLTKQKINNTMNINQYNQK